MNMYNQKKAYLPSFAKSYIPTGQDLDPSIKNKDLLIIKSNFSNSDPNSDFHPYLFFIDQEIKKALPKKILKKIQGQAISNPKTFRHFTDSLPLLHWSRSQSAPGALCISVVCSADFTHGVGRYISDTLSRWVVPGKFLSIFSAQSLNFQFRKYEGHNYFFHQCVIVLHDDKEFQQIKGNLPKLFEEIRLNILAVKHTRKIIATKKLSTEQKAALVQDKIASLFGRDSRDFDRNVFDQMHHFLIKLTAEEKITQIKDKFAPLLEDRPKDFDRDIFNEIQHFTLLFRDKFTASRELRHISRIISFQYLFRKVLQNEMHSKPEERHLSFKLLKTQLQSPNGPKTVLGLLLGMSFLRENEIFEERHIFEAIKHSLSNVRRVKDSYIIDRRPYDKIRLFYLEIEKEDESCFSLKEIGQLRQRLLRELKGCIENVIHPVFMPRNEEEVMRNVVMLSQQLKYVKDIPQVVISFDTQTEQELSFTIILLRLISPDAPTLDLLFKKAKPSFKFLDLETKQVGHLRKKHLKQANIFRVKLAKDSFLRKDYSLNLFEARQAVSSELIRLVGEIRDFNGGILSKQQEVFHELHASLIPLVKINDFLLENFFYSLSPPIMQSILPASLLKTLYLMLIEILEQYSKKDRYLIKTQFSENHLLVMIGSVDPSFKEQVLAVVGHLKIPSSDLVTTSVEAYELSCIGYLYRFEDLPQATNFVDEVQKSLKEWKKTSLKISSYK